MYDCHHTKISGGAYARSQLEANYYVVVKAGLRTQKSTPHLLYCHAPAACTERVLPSSQAINTYFSLTQVLPQTPQHGRVPQPSSLPASLHIS